MTVTIERPTYGDPASADALEATYAAPSADRSQDRETSLSPTADVIEAASTRVTGFLRRRAEMAQKRHDQRDAFASYQENVDATKQRELGERVDNAKAFLRGIGTSALNRLKKTGRSIAEGALIGAATGAVLATELVRSAKDGLNRMDNFVDTKTADAQKFAKDTVTTNAKMAFEVGKYELAQAKERYLERREAARTRRQERRASWQQKRQEFATRARGRYERSKARVDVARGVGSAVISHLGGVWNQVKETNNVAKTAYDDLEGARHP